MTDLAAKLAQLRDQIESAAFLVSKGGLEKQAHSELVHALITLVEIENICSLGKLRSTSFEKCAKEAGKVRSRLKLWARPDRQDQINVRILNAFLRLEKSGVSVISENDLKRELPNVDSFDSNFAQMKAISEKNHGKIFEQDGAAIAIWEPVLSYVREYEQAIEMMHPSRT